MSDLQRLQHREMIRMEGRQNFLTYLLLSASDYLLPWWANAIVYVLTVWHVDATKLGLWNISHSMMVAFGLFKFPSKSLYAYLVIQGAHTGMIYSPGALKSLMISGMSQTHFENLKRRHIVLLFWLTAYTRSNDFAREGLHISSVWQFMIQWVIPVAVLTGVLAKNASRDTLVYWANCVATLVEELKLGSITALSTWEPTKFAYAPLQDRRHIRLLILPRKWILSFLWNPVLCVELIEMDLRGTGHHTAISHRWKNKNNTRSIYMNGYPSEVEESVYHMLKNLRHPCIASRAVWIDSICINQDNLAEKSDQVLLMRHIYPRASQVTGYISSSFYSGWKASKLISSLVYDYRSSASGPRKELYGKYSRPQWESYWDAVSCLLAQDFFCRVWIVQEMVLAKDFEVHYGGVLIPLQNLTLFASCIDSLWQLRISTLVQSRWGHDRYQLFSKSLGNLQKIATLRKSNYTPLKTLAMCRSFDATNPRDKIYALLSMFLTSSDSAPPPNYNDDTSTESVYCEYGKWILAQEPQERISILKLSGIGHPREFTNMTSWIPDWSSKDWPESFDSARDFNASLLSPQEILHPSSSPPLRPDSRLHVKGFLVDYITHNTTINMGVDNVNDFIKPFFEDLPKFYRDFLELHTWEIIEEALNLAIRHSKKAYRTANGSQSLEDAFLRTLLADSVPERHRPSDSTVQECCEYLALMKLFQEIAKYMLEDNLGPRILVLLQTLSTYQLDLAKGLLNAICKSIAAQTASSGDTDREEMTKELRDLHQSGYTCLSGVLEHFGKEKPEDPFQQNQIPFETLGMNRFVVFTRERSFCVTQQRYIGLVPKLCKQGDRVAIILGLNTPCLLRPKNGSDSEFEFVGTCYIHGMMDGEMMDKGFEAIDFVLV